MFYIGEKDQEKVLFVEGIQNPNEILQRCLLHTVSRVHLGFKNTFTPALVHPVNDWNFMFEELVKAKVFKNTFTPALVHPVNDWNFMFEELVKAKVTIDLELTTRYTDNIESWEWTGYKNFNALYEAQDVNSVEKIT